MAPAPKPEFSFNRDPGKNAYHSWHDRYAYGFKETNNPPGQPWSAKARNGSKAWYTCGYETEEEALAAVNQKMNEDEPNPHKARGRMVNQFVLERSDEGDAHILAHNRDNDVRRMVPEVRLIIAIAEQAVADLKNHHLRNDAIQYLTAHDPENPFAFRAICDILGIDCNRALHRLGLSYFIKDENGAPTLDTRPTPGPAIIGNELDAEFAELSAKLAADESTAVA